MKYGLTGMSGRFMIISPAVSAYIIKQLRASNNYKSPHELFQAYLKIMKSVKIDIPEYTVMKLFNIVEIINW